MTGETITAGSGLDEPTSAALDQVLSSVVPAMFKSQQPWALMGSLGSVLQGLDGYAPPDIDLVTSMEGAYIMQGSLAGCGTTLRPVSYSVAPPYESYFGICEVRGVKVEVMGDLIIACPDGRVDANAHYARWSEKVRLLRFGDYSVPVVPLEWQLVANVLLQRPERYRPICGMLLSRGYDRAYLEDLLADPASGDRTIAAVREMLQLDQ